MDLASYMSARACVYPRDELVTSTEVTLPDPSIVTFVVVPIGVSEWEAPAPELIVMYSLSSASANDAAKRIFSLV